MFSVGDGNGCRGGGVGYRLLESSMITAAQFEAHVIQLVKQNFGSLEAFAEAYNKQLDWEAEQEAIDLEGQ